MKLRSAWILGASVVAVLAGCSGSADDKKSPSPSSAPPSSVASTPVSSTPADGGSPTVGGCLAGADYCDHLLKSVPARGALDTSATNHLTAQCIQGTSSGSAQAQLSLSVNGSEVVSINYAKSISNYDWSVGARVGLLVVGEGSDV